MENRKLEGKNSGLSIEIRCDSEYLVCDSCRAWEHFTPSKQSPLFHSKSRCDNKAQYTKEQTMTTVPVVAQVHVASIIVDRNFSAKLVLATDDQRFEAYKKGYISMSEAMNSDF